MLVKESLVQKGQPHLFLDRNVMLTTTGAGATGNPFYNRDFGFSPCLTVTNGFRKDLKKFSSLTSITFLF